MTFAAMGGGSGPAPPAVPRGAAALGLRLPWSDPG